MLVRHLCYKCQGTGKTHTIESTPDPRWWDKKHKSIASVFHTCDVCSGTGTYEVDESCNSCYWYRTMERYEEGNFVEKHVCVNHEPNQESPVKYEDDCCIQFQRVR